MAAVSIWSYRRGAGATLIVAALSWLGACSQGTGQPSDGAKPQPTSTSTGCGEAKARDTLDHFVTAFNNGDVGQLDKLISSSSFAWWSTDAPGARTDPGDRDRSTLIAYFADRHRHRDHLEVKTFRYNGRTASIDNFEFVVLRSADDLSSPTRFGGKGGIACFYADGGIAAWAMSRAG